MPRIRPFAQVDVFGAGPYLGNPVAVVLDGADLADEEMARFAAWTNLSETTFVVPPTAPEADYGLRIWTPGGQLPFAGHPTLGSAHAWLEAGGVPHRDGQLVQECGAGLVDLLVDDDGAVAFKAPPVVRSGPLDDALVERVARVLRLPRDRIVTGQWVDNGPGWLAVLLPSADDVLAVEPDPVELGDLMLGIVGPYDEGAAAQFELRAFCGAIAVPEDPVTGSLNASVAQWLIGAGLAPPAYVASQGARVGRQGRISITSRDGDIWVGGACRTSIRGTTEL